jgi:hypothetical protein
MLDHKIYAPLITGDSVAKMKLVLAVTILAYLDQAAAARLEVFTVQQPFSWDLSTVTHYANNGDKASFSSAANDCTSRGNIKQICVDHNAKRRGHVIYKDSGLRRCFKGKLDAEYNCGCNAGICNKCRLYKYPQVTCSW